MNQTLKSTAQRLRRSPYQSLAAILMMAIAFFVSTVYFLSALSAQRMLTTLEGRPQAIAFFKDEAKPEEVSSLTKEIEAAVKVKSTRYLSKDEALQRYKEQNQKDPLLVELVTATILPASLEVSAVNAADLPEVVKIMKAAPIVEDVAFQQEETQGLVNWVRSLRFSGTILVSVLLLETILVLLIVFALKIALRKEEIGVMRLVGASVWQIRWPFIFEGMFYGIIAGLFAWGASYYFVIVKQINPLGTIPALTDFAVPFAITPPNILIWGLGEILLGIFIGFIGSFLSVWRYLKS